MTGTACATKTGCLFTVEDGGRCESQFTALDLGCGQPDIEYELMRWRRYNDGLNDASFPDDRTHREGTLVWATRRSALSKEWFVLFCWPFLGVSS